MYLGFNIETKLLEEVASEIPTEKDGDGALVSPWDWHKAPSHFDESIHTASISGGEITLDLLDLVKAEREGEILRILSYGVDSANVTSTDFSLIGLETDPWEFSRGARLYRNYRNSDGDVVVRDKYEYTFSDEGRSVVTYIRHIEWYKNNCEVGLTKDITPSLNKKNVKELNRALRQGRMDYLEASAEELRDVADMVPEPYKTQYNAIADSIDVLFSHYSNAVADYISRGTMSFETLVLGETSPNIVAILAIPSSPASPAYPNGLTVKTSILYQLRGWIDTVGDTPGT